MSENCRSLYPDEKRYIGTKIFQAWPQTENEFSAQNAKPEVSEDRPGYGVQYADGYVSWSPKTAFEAAYRPCEAMNFGLALEAIKMGAKVARKGWNGKNMFIFLREGRKITGVDPNSPMGGDFESRAHICMKDAQGMCVVGWLASQTDMLSDDWVLVE